MRSILVLIFSAVVISCDVCSNKLIENVASPDGKHIASVFERNCGATTPFLRVVSLRKSDAKFEPDEHSDWVYTINGQPNVKVLWTENNQIKVFTSGFGEKPTWEYKWKSIKIEYQ